MLLKPLVVKLTPVLVVASSAIKYCASPPVKRNSVNMLLLEFLKRTPTLFPLTSMPPLSYAKLTVLPTASGPAKGLTAEVNPPELA